MNAAHKNRHAALLKATGYEDGAALTLNSTDGDIPHGRELSFAWLAGTVMTGLTSVLLMGAALYVSFKGQDTFSTPYAALTISAPDSSLPPTDLAIKADRMRPIVKTRSDMEIIEASIRELEDGRAMIKKQPFVRLRATLATAATNLTDDVPAYDAVAMMTANTTVESPTDTVNTDIYGAEVEGEVAVKVAPLPVSFVPPRAISDQGAADFVRLTVEGNYFDLDPTMLAYAPPPGGGVRELGTEATDSLLTGVAENITALGKTVLPDEAGLGRTERILTIKEGGSLGAVLLKNGFSEMNVAAVSEALRNVVPPDIMKALKLGTRLRILLAPSRDGQTLIPVRLSIYFHDNASNSDIHQGTVALTDRGLYVLGIKPADIVFPDEDTEQINVSNLPTLYKALWETGRKHDLADDTISRIVAMYAYDVDLTKKVTPGDQIEMLETPPDAEGRSELLYVGLTINGTLREMFRFRTEDGMVDFYDPDGETGQRFLNRRPLQGGGVVRSNFGYRIHPIFHTRKLHTGVDLAAKSGTPIYAAGDGTIELAGWQSGYGKKVEIAHVNGFETAYGHMSRIADGIKPGVKVRQGQVIGYVGSTGNSTGPHLHFEIKINGNFVDPLGVKLPRENTLAAQYEGQFSASIAQIRDLMQRDGESAPVTMASVQ
ncbi:MAG: Membrane protein related to metalloendopeptidase [Devosia sp.]|nr:Membrane protein related to metalloendopeptidase [Devosia sp.]